MSGAGAGGAGSFERWLAHLHVDDAARARARRHWLRSAAEEDASLAGVLLDLAERDVGVVVTTAAGRRHVGVIAVVGADFVAVRTPSGRHVLLRHTVVTSVRASPDEVGPIGDREVTSTGTLTDVMILLAGERLPATLVVGAHESVSGELRSVGQDVVVVRTEGERPATVYVSTERVDEVALDGPPDQSFAALESG